LEWLQHIHLEETVDFGNLIPLCVPMTPPGYFTPRTPIERLLEQIRDSDFSYPSYNTTPSYGASMVSNSVPIEPNNNNVTTVRNIAEVTNMPTEHKRKRSPRSMEDRTPPPIPTASVSIPSRNGKGRMKPFAPAQVTDWKHVLYNLLVEHYNAANQESTLVSPVEVVSNGILRHGFSFNPNMQPRKRIAELYARHVRKETLEFQDQKSNFTEDLYKYYLRCAYQLMCKYFMKVGPFTYVYEDVPLFIAGEPLAEAEDRLRNIDTKHRRKKKKAALQETPDSI